ncbi:EthD family reductase [Egibacter rhizosphaerae]|uniref:EthD family reductase n=1 Tax=Egibacter rhizosphaerae TaxID=1670831 RepID=UPI0013F15124|nr:EthD family reductase [Egibacter rhizosphaerae]
MIKIVSLMKRREDLSLEDFRAWALQEHVEHGKRLPGLREYRMSVVIEDDPNHPYDAVSELWFDDDEARTAAFATEAGRAAGEDVAAHTSARTRLITEERRVF